MGRDPIQPRRRQRLIVRRLGLARSELLLVLVLLLEEQMVLLELEQLSLMRERGRPPPTRRVERRIKHEPLRWAHHPSKLRSTLTGEVV